ncbi:carboxypeptidase-like regulatory domain-containing protein [Candidatus Parabeggiatoa sp. HSG14]|uniref:carboxypeptidase-like regulatory domain-containing protein n=1 Tax=Candidatus Parabeggiatoa sp. HSG14 TaxID=3055593 RepID=UPI0025A8D9FB|nr:carboxypeptidase-like regulatory domain-containing protein [Thiotrichales bacterium HSG14]
MKKSFIALSSLMASALFFPVNSLAYNVVDVTNGGTITGKVTFTGSQEEANKHNKMYTITKDTDVCGEGTREINYVDVKGDILNDVVVYLKKVKKGKAWNESEKNVKIDQKACEFMPFFAVMANKGKLTATNSDAVAHNIHTYELIGKARKSQINISQPDQGSEVNKTIRLRRGAGMKVECDQHDFMHSFVFVAKNPYYAVVAEDGTYQIKNIPAGKYKVATWHGYLKDPKVQKNIAVKAGKTATVNFEYTKKKK